MPYKTVYIPITIPSGEYCWGEGGMNSEVCLYFDNEGGSPRCTLWNIIDTDDLKYAPEGGVKKPKQCLELSDNFIRLIKEASSGKKV